MTRTAVVIAEPGRVVAVREACPPPGAGELLVRIRCSAISSGTERLAYHGVMPADLPLDEHLKHLKTKPAYPMRYGYCAVGRVAACGPGEPPEWMNRRVFAFHPHASHAVLHPDALVPLPDTLADEDALFLANMETAVSLLMDGRPMIGERVLVLGAGVVGQLTTALLARMALEEVAVCDISEPRRTRAHTFGAHSTFRPEELAGSACRDFDLVYELSGNPAALDLAIRHARYHGRIVVGSWYGTRKAALDLGGRFHRAKLSIYSSQVGTIDPGLAGRWNKQRRLHVALEQLAGVRPSQLITHVFPVERAGEAYALLDEAGFSGLQIILTYNDNDPR